MIRKSIRKETGASDLSILEQRRAWIDYAATQSTHRNVTLHEKTVAGVPCLWLASKDSNKTSTIVYLHGGGLVDGAIATHREFVSRLVAITGHRAVMVEYRLLPEHKFPSALEDVLSVFEALSSSGEVDSSRLVIGGDSSGGGLAVSAMMRLVREQKNLPVCAFTVSGVFDMTLSGETMESRNDLDPCLSFEALQSWILDFEGYDLSEESISPLFGKVRNLPPILLQVGDHEVWLDDSRRMKEKIEAYDGVAELRVWDSMWHVWHMYSGLPEASEAIEEIGDFIDERIEQNANQTPQTNRCV